jgi:hypothetical protein
MLLGAAIQAHAITITPTKSEYEPGGVRYYFVVSSWYPSNTGEPSPCLSNDPAITLCPVYLVAHKPPGYFHSVGFHPTSWRVPIRRGSWSIYYLLKDMETKGFQIPYIGSIFVPQQDVSANICISFSYSTIGPAIGGGLSLFGPCARVAPPVMQCDITGDAVIDHKTLADNAVDGATASTQLNVQCRGPASVTVSTTRTDAYGVRLKADGSLYSKVTVNGKDATAGINVPVTKDLPTPLTITSTLVKRADVTPGAFLGSTVVTVSPP